MREAWLILDSGCQTYLGFGALELMVKMDEGYALENIPAPLITFVNVLRAFPPGNWFLLDWLKDA